VVNYDLHKEWGAFRVDKGNQTMNTILRRSIGALTMVSAVLIGTVGASAAPPQGIEGNVTIQNEQNNPVPVIFSTSAPLPVQSRTGEVSATKGTVYTVPNGQRLIIEFVSVAGDKSAQASDVRFSIETVVNSTTVIHNLAHKLPGDFNADGVFVDSRPVQLYADQNTEVVFRLLTNLGTGPTWRGTISGRLEPMQNN
jgi:hypothetical protein